jgi:hypothetical protein
MTTEVDSNEFISQVLHKAKENGFYNTSKFILMKKKADKLVRGQKYIFLEKKRGADNKIEYLGEYKGSVESVVVDAKRKIAKVSFQGGKEEPFDGSADFLSYPDYLAIKAEFPPTEGEELPVLRDIPGKLEKGPLVPHEIEMRSAENPKSDLSEDSVQRRRPHPVRVKPGEALNPPIRDTEPVVKNTEPVVRDTEPVVKNTEPADKPPSVRRSEPMVKRSEPMAENVAKKSNRTSRKRSPAAKAKYNRRSGSYCPPKTRRCASTGKCVPVVAKPAGQKRCPRGSGQRRCADQVCYPVS